VLFFAVADAVVVTAVAGVVVVENILKRLKNYFLSYFCFEFVFP